MYNNIHRPFPRQFSRPAAPARAEGRPGSFGNILNEAIQQVNDVEKASPGELQKIAGRESDLNSVMMALEQADLSFQVMMQVRNKMVQAYQEIMATEV